MVFRKAMGVGWRRVARSGINKFKLQQKARLLKLQFQLMLKNQTVNTNQHDFILAKIRPYPHESILAVSFEPIRNHALLFESIAPHFNRDGHHFTPAFLLPRDQKFYRENINFERLKFDDRIQNAQQKKILQNNYKCFPSSDYCQLCRTTFDHYLHHTQSQQHRNQIAASTANLYIDDLATNFLPSPKPTHKILKKPKNERGRLAPKKKSGKLPEGNINNITKAKKMQVTIDSKNSNQSTNLMSDSY